MVALTPLPEALPGVGGVLNYRGRVIPVVDGRTRLGLALRDPDPSALIVVVETNGSAAGVVVDEVLDVVALPGGAVQAPDGTYGGSPAVSAVAHRGDGLVVVLDCAQLLASARPPLLPPSSVDAQLSGRGAGLCAETAGVDVAAAGLRAP